MSNYRMTSNQRRAARATAAPTVAPDYHGMAWDGERLGVLTFDLRADYLRHYGLWVYAACYNDLQACKRRVASLADSFGVEFYAVKIPTYYLADGASPAISESGWYAATGVEHTAELRRHVQRAYDVARALTPRDARDERAESEA